MRGSSKSTTPYGILLWVCGAFAAAACVVPMYDIPVYFTATAPKRPPRPKNAPLKIFLTTTPDHPYEELGLLQVHESLDATLAPVALAARKHGANAVMLMSTSHHVTSSTYHETVETKDRKGKVVHTQQVPVTSTSTEELNRFVALWVQKLEDETVAERAARDAGRFNAGLDGGQDLLPPCSRSPTAGCLR